MSCWASRIRDLVRGGLLVAACVDLHGPVAGLLCRFGERLHGVCVLAAQHPLEAVLGRVEVGITVGKDSECLVVRSPLTRNPNTFMPCIYASCLMARVRFKITLFLSLVMPTSLSCTLFFQIFVSIVISVCFVVSRVALADDPVAVYRLSALHMACRKPHTGAGVWAQAAHSVLLQELLESSASSDFATEWKLDDIA